MINLPIFRAKSNEQKNTYVEGLLIGVDEELNLCTIRTKDDYIGGEVCYLHTLSINFPDMLDSQGNKIFASLQEDGKGGDEFLFDNEIFIIWFDNQSLKINATNKDNFECSCHDSLQEWYDFNIKCYDLKVIGIQK